MIESAVVTGLVAFLESTKPEELEDILVRPYDSDEKLAGPPLVVVRVRSAKSRVRGTNLIDGEIEVAVRANPADTDMLIFDAVWAWLSDALYPATAAVAALTNDALHCYTLQADPSDSEITLDENERSRQLVLTGVFVDKTLT